MLNKDHMDHKALGDRMGRLVRSGYSMELERKDNKVHTQAIHKDMAVNKDHMDHMDRRDHKGRKDHRVHIQEHRGHRVPV